MNISALYYDYHDKSGEQINHINKFVAAGLLYIIGNYFSSWSSYFVLTMCCRNEHTCNFYNNMFYKMFPKWSEWPLQIVVVNNNNYRKVPGARQYNMIFTDSYKAFSETEIHTYSTENNNNEYYFIFLQIRDHLALREMQKIFEYCWQHYLINCIIQVQTAKGRVLIYTYYPFTEKHCNKVEVVLYNEYNGTSLIHEDLFPKKLKNFYGCPLRAALWHVPPYVNLSTDSNNVTHVAGGFEGKLLLELSKKLNFSLDVIIPPNHSKHGMVLQNGSLTGGLKLLRERRADIRMGSFRQTSERSGVATPTINYFQTICTVVTISEAYILTSLETILFPFTTNTWFILAFTFSFALTLVYLSKWIFRKAVSKPLDKVTLDILLMLLGMPGLCTPISNATRIMNASWTMFSLILRTVYHALLFHLIRTHVTRHMPQTLEELVHKNYSMVANPPIVAVLNDIPLFKDVHFITLNTSSDTMALDYLEILPLENARHVVAAISEVFFQYYTESLNKVGIFKVLPHTIMSFNMCIYVTKHSFLIEYFNEVLKLIRGFGILEAWYRQEININYFGRRDLLTDHIFGLQQLKMAFIFLVIGYILATLVFLLEHIYKRMEKRKCLKKLF